MKECHNCKKSIWCQLENKNKDCKIFEPCERVKTVSMFKELQYK
jgi:hypothetical protein